MIDSWRSATGDRRVIVQASPRSGRVRCSVLRAVFGVPDAPVIYKECPDSIPILGRLFRAGGTPRRSSRHTRRRRRGAADPGRAARLRDIGGEPSGESPKIRDAGQNGSRIE